MPLTPTGIYYADTSTNMSIADITAAMATSVGGALRILQVVSNSSVTTTANNSVNYTASGESVTITPKSTSSKILLIAAVPYYITGSAAAGNYTLFKGTTSGTDLSGGSAGFGQIYSGYGDVRAAVGMTFLDSPATTSAITYLTAHRSNSAAITLNSHPSGSKGTLTAIEVAV